MSDTTLSFLCYGHDLTDPGSKEFAVNGKQLFAVKKHNQIYVYLNRCPHAGLPLNWMPNQFLDSDKELIQCTSHGALFQIDTGVCVAGPCPGRKLIAVPFEFENGRLSVATSALQNLR